MKKYIFAALLFCTTLGSGIFAQKNTSAFKNLSLNLEFMSTNGWGVEVATPLHHKFTLRGGVSLLPLSYSSTYKMTIDENIKNTFNNILNFYPDLSNELVQNGLPTNIADINSDINSTARIKLINSKLLFDYYPSAKYSFHITGGVYVGTGEPIKLRGNMNDQAIQFLNLLNDHGINYFDEPYIKNNEKGYHLTGRDIMDITGAIKVNPVKPYLGFGFGRAVPKNRVGVNFEIGALYQGAAKIISSNKNFQKIIDYELTEVSKVLSKIPIYPVLSLKLNFRVF